MEIKRGTLIMVIRDGTIFGVIEAIEGEFCTALFFEQNGKYIGKSTCRIDPQSFVPLLQLSEMAASRIEKTKDRPDVVAIIINRALNKHSYEIALIFGDRMAMLRQSIAALEKDLQRHQNHPLAHPRLFSR